MKNPLGFSIDVYTPDADETENASGRTEKVTVNLPLMTLAQIEALVDVGHFQSRAEFLRFSALQQLEKFETLERTPWMRKEYEQIVVIGILSLSNKSLIRARDKQKSIRVTVAGMLIIKDDIDLDMFSTYVDSIKVWGSIKCNSKVRGIVDAKINRRISLY